MNTSRYPRGKTVSSLALLMFVCLIVAGVRAQQPENTQTAASYEGQKVGSVEIAGQPDLNRRAVANLIAQPINAPYSQQQVDATVQARKKPGKYTGVKVQVSPEANGL